MDSALAARREPVAAADGDAVRARVCALMLDTATLGIFALDPQLQIVYVNGAAAGLVGTQPDALLGRSAVDLIHPDDVAMVATSLTYVAGGRAVLPTVLRLVAAGGTPVWVEGTVQAYDNDDPSLRFVVTVRDPTSRLAVDDFVQSTLSAELGDAMHCLVRLIEAEGDFGATIHWGGRGAVARFAAGDAHLRRMAADPAFAPVIAAALLQGSTQHRLRDLGVDHGGSDRRSVYAIATGTGPDAGVVVGWLPYDGSLGPAGRNLFTRVANLAALALGRHGADTRLKIAASTDSLTGLANRGAFHERLGAARVGGEPFALVLLDLDGFKAINDTHGHDAGDAVLQEVAIRLRATLPRALSSRLGGDEFALLLYGVDAAGTLDRAVAALDVAIRAPILTTMGPVTVGASFGAVLARGGDADDDLMLRADRAMYRCKRAGRPAPPAR